MKILITGAGGLLGTEVWRALEAENELVAMGRTRPPYVTDEAWRECDLTRPELTYQTVTRENPDLVIHTAAFSDVDGAEKRPEYAYRGNAMATRNLALACQRFDATLMYVSTDYVFDGENPPAEGYREFDDCHPVSVYGESKRWGELFVTQLLTKFFIVRTSWLFGPARASWVDRIVASLREGAAVPAVKDMTSSPTYTPDLAAAMKTLAEGQRFGIYHLTNSGACTRVELAEEVAKLHPKLGKANIRMLTQAELSLPARRPAHSTLQNLAWKLDGHAPLRTWQKALAKHFERASVTR